MAELNTLHPSTSDTVSVGIAIDGREYSLKTDINPYALLDEHTIREAIEVILKSGVGVGGWYGGLLIHPDVKKAMKDRNEQKITTKRGKE